MANNRSTEKRIRQTERTRGQNRATKSRMRTAVKELRGAVAAGDSKRAKSLLPTTLQLLDATAQKGAIHRNAAARTKSRLEKAVAGLDA
ncbi:MAG: 30S ribosomal protein S20 [Thermoanaerobaculia bacterium]